MLLKGNRNGNTDITVIITGMNIPVSLSVLVFAMLASFAMGCDVTGDEISDVLFEDDLVCDVCNVQSTGKFPVLIGNLTKCENLRMEGIMSLIIIGDARVPGNLTVSFLKLAQRSRGLYSQFSSDKEGRFMTVEGHIHTNYYEIGSSSLLGNMLTGAMSWTSENSLLIDVRDARYAITWDTPFSFNLLESDDSRRMYPIGHSFRGGGRHYKDPLMTVNRDVARNRITCNDGETCALNGAIIDGEQCELSISGDVGSVMLISDAVWDCDRVIIRSKIPVEFHYCSFNSAYVAIEAETELLIFGSSFEPTASVYINSGTVGSLHMNQGAGSLSFSCAECCQMESNRWIMHTVVTSDVFEFINNMYMNEVIIHSESTHKDVLHGNSARNIVLSGDVPNALEVMRINPLVWTISTPSEMFWANPENIRCSRAWNYHDVSARGSVVNEHRLEDKRQCIFIDPPSRFACNAGPSVTKDLVGDGNATVTLLLSNVVHPCSGERKRTVVFENVNIVMSVYGFSPLRVWFEGWKSIRMLNCSIDVLGGVIADGGAFEGSEMIMEECIVKDNRRLDVDNKALMVSFGSMLLKNCEFDMKSHDLLLRSIDAEEFDMTGSVIIDCGGYSEESTSCVTLVRPSTLNFINNEFVCNNMVRNDGIAGYRLGVTAHHSYSLSIYGTDMVSNTVNVDSNKFSLKRCNGILLDTMEEKTVRMSLLNVPLTKYRWNTQKEGESHEIVSNPLMDFAEKTNTSFTDCDESNGYHNLAWINMDHVQIECTSVRHDDSSVLASVNTGTDSSLCPTVLPSQCIVDAPQYMANERCKYTDVYIHRSLSSAVRLCPLDDISFQSEYIGDPWITWDVKELPHRRAKRIIRNGIFHVENGHPHILSAYESLEFVNCTFIVSSETRSNGKNNYVFDRDVLASGDLSFVDCIVKHKEEHKNIPCRMFKDRGVGKVSIVEKHVFKMTNCTLNGVNMDILGYDIVEIRETCFIDSLVSVHGGSDHLISGNRWKLQAIADGLTPNLLALNIHDSSSVCCKLSGNAFTDETTTYDKRITAVVVSSGANRGESTLSGVETKSNSFSIVHFDAAESVGRESRNIAYRMMSTNSSSVPVMEYALVEGSLFDPVDAWIHMTVLSDGDLGAAFEFPNEYPGLVCDLLLDCSVDFFNKAILIGASGIFALLICCSAYCIIIRPAVTRDSRRGKEKCN